MSFCSFSPTLVLNADYQPLSYFPLSLWSWQDTIKAVFLERVNIVSEYEEIVRSPGLSMKIPSVISLKQYVKTQKNPVFSRFNVFLRDKFSCQYCGLTKETHELTFDHVIPRSLGGKTNWNNVVTACGSCNFKKGSKSLSEINMLPIMKPEPPNTNLLKRNGRCFPPNFLHKSWHDFLYWDIELENNY
jgi:5-methylcytosine-specific restriction endonuclease McrA